LIWARCGGGHRVAKDSLQQRFIHEYAEKGIDLDVSRTYDMMGEFFLDPLGNFIVYLWDKSQRKGKVKTQSRLIALQKHLDRLVFPIVYLKMLHLLLSLPEEPEYVVSTQPIATLALLKAIRYVNLKRGWKVRLHLYLTDMPTQKASHFLRSLKRIGRDPLLAPLLTVYSPPAITESEDFWRQSCGMLEVITDRVFPIRNAFLQTDSLKEKLESPHLMLSMGEQSYLIEKETKVTFLMLGSQPPHRGVLDWVDAIIARAQNTKEKHFFFVYCGPNEHKDLLKAVTKRLSKAPEGLTIIPLQTQAEENLALLMARCNRTITRSGGSTSMELLHLFQSGAIFDPLNRETVIHDDGVSHWEAGNAFYLMQTIQAKYRTPFNFQ
jgi:hypothetical protein